MNNEINVLQHAMNDSINGDGVEKRVDDLFKAWEEGNYNTYTLAIAAYRSGKGDAIGPMLTALMHGHSASAETNE